MNKELAIEGANLIREIVILAMCVTALLIIV